MQNGCFKGSWSLPACCICRSLFPKFSLAIAFKNSINKISREILASVFFSLNFFSLILWVIKFLWWAKLKHALARKCEGFSFFCCKSSKKANTKKKKKMTLFFSNWHYFCPIFQWLQLSKSRLPNNKWGNYFQNILKIFLSFSQFYIKCCTHDWFYPLISLTNLLQSNSTLQNSLFNCS